MRFFARNSHKSPNQTSLRLSTISYRNKSEVRLHHYPHLIMLLSKTRFRSECYKHQRSTLFYISVSPKEQQGFCQRQLALRRVLAHRKIVGTRHPVHKYKQLVFTVLQVTLVDSKLHNIRCPPLPAWPTTVLLLFDCLHLFASIVPMCRHSMPGWDHFRLVTPDTEASGGSFRRSLSRFLW